MYRKVDSLKRISRLNREGSEDGKVSNGMSSTNLQIIKIRKFYIVVF